MNLNTILKKSWKMLWHYRALWLFGAILALVIVNAIFIGPWQNQENNDQWIEIKVSDNTTIRVPGADMTIDLTAPEGVRIITPDVASWREFRDLVDELKREEGIDLWSILVESIAILAISLLLGMVARYITETAVIRMVNDAEEMGQRLNMREGLRRGLSFRAVRLFLLDLIIAVLAAMAFVLVFGLAVTPLLLAIGNHEAVIITAGVATLGLLVLGIYMWLAAGAVLSLVLQPVRRACALEEQSLWASIRQGITITKQHLKELSQIWLIWIGIRLLWVPLGLLVFILLSPVLLLTILAGVAMGGLPAALVAAIASLYTGDITSWIMGALAGLPIFILVLISPMLFVSGLIEIYKSCIWTLAYRDLKALQHPVRKPAPAAPIVPATGSAD